MLPRQSGALGLNSNYLGHAVTAPKELEDIADAQFVDTSLKFAKAGRITAVTFWVSRQAEQADEFAFRVYRLGRVRLRKASEPEHATIPES